MVRFLSGPDREPEQLLPDFSSLSPASRTSRRLPGHSLLPGHTLAQEAGGREEAAGQQGAEEEEEEGDLSLLPVFLVPAPQTSVGCPVSPHLLPSLLPSLAPHQLPSLLASLARENSRSDSSPLLPVCTVATLQAPGEPPTEQQGAESAGGRLAHGEHMAFGSLD